MDFVQSLPDAANAVMIIGHNPTFHSAAIALAKSAAPGKGDDLQTVKEKFPTGALCSIAFDVPQWKQVKAGSGTLTGFVRPRDLSDD
jgi:phosphohistidine phosphatase